MALHALDELTREGRQRLTAMLDAASGTPAEAGQPARGCERVDTFLAMTSRHLNAVEAVLLPAVRRLPDGAHLVHDHVDSCRALERSLALAKARQYGEAYAIHDSWGAIWPDVRARLDANLDREQEMVGRLEQVLPDDELDQLGEDLHGAELHAPTRPHPHVPHTGFAGRVSRRVLGVVDGFWDTAEGRVLPPPPRPRRTRPGLLGQYLLADPRFDEQEHGEGEPVTGR